MHRVLLASALVVMNGTAQDSVVRFLRDHPSGHLYVLVGFASIWGLSWLHQHTIGREVTLVIGNTRKRYFKNGTSEDRREANDFLARRDVAFRNWYRTSKNSRGASDLHIKGWLVVDGDNQPQGGLNGSANLTKKGLIENIEFMSAVTGGDLSEMWNRFDEFLKGSDDEKAPWDCRGRLFELINDAPSERSQPGGTRPGVARDRTGGTRPNTPGSDVPPEPKGCLATLLAIPALVVVLAFAWLWPW